MGKIPQYEPQENPVQPLPGRSPERLYADPDAFGAGTGLQSVGAGLEDVSTSLYDTEQKQEVSDVRTKMATLRGTLTAGFEQAAAKSQPGDSTFADTFMGNVTNQLADMGGTINTRAGRSAFQQESASITSDFLAKSTSYQIASAGAKAVTDFKTTLNENAGTLFNDPTQFGSIIKSMDANFSDPNSAFANVPAEQKGALELQAKESLAIAAARGVARLNPFLAQKQYDAGTLPGQSMLTEEGNAQVIQNIQTAVNGERTKRIQADADAERQQREASENDAVSVLRHIERNPTDPGNTDLILNSRMKAPQMNELLDVAKHVAGPDNNHDTNTYGTGFLQAYSDIHTGTIKDPSELWKQVPAGTLSVAGVNLLTQEIQGKRTPDGDMEAQLKSGFVRAATSQISGENEITRMRDPNGAVQTQKMLSWFLPAYAAAKQKGDQTTQQILDPANPKGLWAGVAQFKRSPQQYMADMMSANPGQVVGAPAAAPKKAVKFKDLP